MKLPKRDQAIIEDEKIRDYLLSREHPIGKYKCVVFESIGYSLSNWQRLKLDILETFLNLDVQDVIEGKHGTKYLIRGNLNGPNGKAADLLSVWVIETGTDVPRFVTLYPGG